MPGACCSCAKPDSGLACSRCKKAIYCGPDCQKKDWPTHKLTCRRPGADDVCAFDSTELQASGQGQAAPSWTMRCPISGYRWDASL